MAEDDVEAVKWYRKAAEQNDAAAEYNQGVCYDRDDGVAEDHAERRNGIAKPPTRMTPMRNTNWASATIGATAWRRIGSRLTSGCCWQRGKAMRLLRST